MKVIAKSTLAVRIGDADVRIPVEYGVEVPDNATEHDIEMAIFTARKNSSLGTIDGEIVKIEK